MSIPFEQEYLVHLQAERPKAATSFIMKALFIISIIVAALFTYAFPAAIIQLIRSLKKMRKVSRMQKFTIAVGILIAIVVIGGLWYVPVRLNQRIKASKADIKMVTEEPGTLDPVDEIVLQ